MKICFYSPYIPKHTGGGEKHLFDVAKTVATIHDVVLAIPDSENLADQNNWKQKYESFLGYSLTNINFISTPLGTTASSIYKVWWTKQFDYLYYVTDGSLFFSLAKKNNAHIQFPFTFSKESIIDRLKLKNWSIKNTNSEFTKNVIERSWKTRISFVHYPLVNISEFNPAKKKDKTILHVGRFFRQLHSKRQDVLIEVFKQMCTEYANKTKGWNLVLAGVVEDQVYFDQLQASAKGFPITFETDVSRQKLISLYNKASIYWHATGFEVDEMKHPEAVEHFGISTLEAIAAGCIPIVVGKGGQKEILGPKLQQLLWNTKQECIDITMQYIQDRQQDVDLRKILAERVDGFTTIQFEQTLWRMFDA